MLAGQRVVDVISRKDFFADRESESAKMLGYKG